jgi:dihydroorotate dehydrogenase (fumarate)
MPDLSTTLMGLPLRNPVVVASSRLTSWLDGIRACADAGAGAVVLKSLFEEQVMADTDRSIQQAAFLNHTEAEDYFVSMGRDRYLEEYFQLVEAAKKAVGIPVIASVNCITAETWIESARGFESAGADALELNVFIQPFDPSVDGRRLEAHYLDLAARVSAGVKIPVAMKIGHHFTGMAQMIKALSDSGLGALVLFNRFHRPDIDVESLELRSASIFSAPEEMALTLQWVALMAGQVGCDLVANTGIHDGESVIKQLLAGAQAAELCTAVQRRGAGYIGTVLESLSGWMVRHSFGAVSDFRGLLSRERSAVPRSYERSQYVKSLTASA